MVPKRLKEARERAGLTQDQLAQQIDIEGANTSSRLSNYEVGRSEPPFALIVKIAKVLNCPEYYFYILDDEVAQNVLIAHRNKTSPSLNPDYDKDETIRKLKEQRDDARKLLSKLSDCLKD